MRLRECSLAAVALTVIACRGTLTNNSDYGKESDAPKEQNSSRRAVRTVDTSLHRQDALHYLSLVFVQKPISRSGLRIRIN